MLTVWEYGCYIDGRIHWLCKCDCGNEKLIAPHFIRPTKEKYQVKSCGCNQYTQRMLPGRQRAHKPWSERKHNPLDTPAKRRQHSREYIEYDKANNLCVRCHKKMDRKGLECQTCTDRRNEYRTQWKNMRKDQGLCTKCGKEKPEERRAFSTCIECAKQPVLTPEERLLRRVQSHNLSPEEYNTMLENQGGVCAICRRATKSFHIDHSHITGRVRGILCNSCNLGLGMFKDKSHILERAILYLLKDIDARLTRKEGENNASKTF
jgi:Recombination endonuclease VII